MTRLRLLLAFVLVALSACGSSSTATKATLPDLDTMSCAGHAPAPAAASSLPALQPLAAKEATPIAGRIVGHGHGGTHSDPPVAATPGLAQQLRVAADTACTLPTADDARRAGYVVSSSYTDGVGTHWTNWSLVDAPFDPARPSMLLYDLKDKLVGFSYWVRSSSAPAGFAGDADHWHRHFGLCFVNGYLAHEDVTTPGACEGTWLNGSDIWMLHAWVVPARPNAWGVFAGLNPALCRRNVADLLRCPGM